MANTSKARLVLLAKQRSYSEGVCFVPIFASLRLCAFALIFLLPKRKAQNQRLAVRRSLHGQILA
jgi:hypothetical protein